jgi:hypothetical protein
MHPGQKYALNLRQDILTSENLHPNPGQGFLTSGNHHPKLRHDFLTSGNHHPKLRHKITPQTGIFLTFLHETLPSRAQFGY